MEIKHTDDQTQYLDKQKEHESGIGSSSYSRLHQHIFNINYLHFECYMLNCLQIEPDARDTVSSFDKAHWTAVFLLGTSGNDSGQLDLC